MTNLVLQQERNEADAALRQANAQKAQDIMGYLAAGGPATPEMSSFLGGANDMSAYPGGQAQYAADIAKLPAGAVSHRNSDTAGGFAGALANEGDMGQRREASELAKAESSFNANPADQALTDKEAADTKALGKIQGIEANIPSSEGEGVGIGSILGDLFTTAPGLLELMSMIVTLGTDTPALIAGGLGLDATDVGSMAAVNAGLGAATGAATGAASGNALGGALTGAVGGGVGGALGGGGTAEGAAAGAGSGAAAGAASSALGGQNPLGGAISGGLSGGISGGISGSSGGSSTSGALAPTTGQDLTSVSDTLGLSGDQQTPIPDSTALQQTPIPGDATNLSTSDSTSVLQTPASGDVTATTGTPTASGGGSSSSGGSGQPNSSVIGNIATKAAVPVATGLAVPAILSALGLGPSNASSAAGATSTLPATTQTATQTPTAAASVAPTDNTVPTPDIPTPDVMGEALTPEDVFNPAVVGGYSNVLSTGGQAGYGSGSLGGEQAAPSGLPSGYSTSSVAQDFGV